MHWEHIRPKRKKEGKVVAAKLIVYAGEDKNIIRSYQERHDLH
jgi:hypothetical protein